MRTVFSIELGVLDASTRSEITMIKADRMPGEVPVARQLHKLDLSSNMLPDWGQPSAVFSRGQKIRDELRKHPGISQVLDDISRVPLGNIQPIYIKLNGGDPELITWETLCDLKDQFVALDQRWPIGRISDPPNGPAVRLFFQNPIKVMAIISAYGIPDQSTEWLNLFNIIYAVRQTGLNVCIKFLVGNEEISSQINDKISTGIKWIEVSHIEETASRVIQEIKNWQPNVVHFFCHGFVDHQTYDQWLELATNSDYADPMANSGSVKLRMKQLAEIGMSLSNPWLLTLNCCSSGRAVRDLQSMANAAVSHGFPAAVAMLEPIDASDAYEFTRFFYTELFTKLQQVEEQLNHNLHVSLEWAELLYHARLAIFNRYQTNNQANCYQWALPVLYVRGLDPVPFERPLQSRAIPEIREEDIIKLKLVAEWLRSVGETMPEETCRKIMAKVLAGIPEQYWPSVKGTFSDD